MNSQVTYGTTKESDTEYHSKSIFEGGGMMSSHALMTFLNSPSVFNGRLAGLIKGKDSDSYKEGRGAHCLILEGKDEYRKRYTFGGPVNEKTGKPYGQQTKKYEEWAAEQRAAGKEVLTDSMDTRIEFMANGVRQHPDCMEALQEGEAECVARANYCGLECQIKIDWLKPGAIIDLKTCRELKWFKNDFKQYRYANQLSFYQKMFEVFAGVRLPIYVIAVEKAQPYHAAFFEIYQDLLDKAQRENEDAIHRMRECISSGIWPTGWEGTNLIS